MLCNYVTFQWASARKKKKLTNLIGENTDVYKTVSNFFYEPTRGKAFLNFVLVNNRIKGKTDYV